PRAVRPRRLPRGGGPMRTLPIATPGATAAALGRAVLRHRTKALAAFALTLAASIGIVVGPVVLGGLVDSVREGAAAGRLVAEVALLAGIMVVTAVLSALSLRSVERLGAELA